MMARGGHFAAGEEPAHVPFAAGGRVSFEIYDPLRPASLADPAAGYRLLRDASPVYWHGDLASWLVTDHALASEVLQDSDTFVADWRRAGFDVPAELLSVQLLDPPVHTPMRARLNKSLPAAADDSEEKAAHLTATMLGKFSREASGPGFDLIGGVLRPVARQLAADLAGIEFHDGDAFCEASDAVVASMDPGLRPDLVEPGKIARETINRSLREYAGTAAPGSFLQRMFHAPDLPGTGLSEDWVLNSCRATLQAAFQSWGRFIGIAALHLIEKELYLESPSPYQLTLLVNELLRFGGSVQTVARVAVADTVLGSQQIRAGDAVIVLPGAAGRDPSVFPDPDELRPDRTPNPHLAFGRGVHFCAGAHHSLRWSRGVIRTFLAVPRMRLAGEPVWYQNASIRGLRSIPVAWA